MPTREQASMTPEPVAVTADDLAALSEIRRTAAAFAPVGSRVTCNPPPDDTDADFLVLAADAHNLAALRAVLADAGFTTPSARYAADESDDRGVDDLFGFESYRRGIVNVLLTGDGSFYRRFTAATSVAKRLNLLRKADRIALFQAVLYGNACKPARKTWRELVTDGLAAFKGA